MYIDNEVLEKMIMTMVEGFNRLEKKLDRMNRLKDCLDGDTLLDNCEMCIRDSSYSGESDSCSIGKKRHFRLCADWNRKDCFICNTYYTTFASQ